MFGSFGKIPRTQQQFEGELFRWIWAYERHSVDKRAPVFLELEGKKIGNIHLPLTLRGACERGIHVLCTASLDTRVNRLVQEYWFEEADQEARSQMERFFYFVRENIDTCHRILTHPHLIKKLG